MLCVYSFCSVGACPSYVPVIVRLEGILFCKLWLLRWFVRFANVYFLEGQVVISFVFAFNVIRFGSHFVHRQGCHILYGRFNSLPIICNFCPINFSFLFPVHTSQKFGSFDCGLCSLSKNLISTKTGIGKAQPTNIAFLEGRIGNSLATHLGCQAPIFLLSLDLCH
jgi:hypothetical protein